jgi:RNA polymerase sigma-70 factor, ECF subfamily
MMLELTCQQSRAMVSDYMNGDLDQERVQALEDHLQHCTSCPPLYASLVEVQRRLRQEQRPALSPDALLDLSRRISQSVLDHQEQRQ